MGFVRISRQRPLRLVLLALLAGLLALPVGIAPAAADTTFPPSTGAFTATVTVDGTTYTYPNGGPGPTIPNLDDGQDVTVTVSDTGPEASNFSSLRVRQCRSDLPVDDTVTFNPGTFNRCSGATLGLGTEDAFALSGPQEPGTTSVTLPFTIGEGVAPDLPESPIDGLPYPGFTCGPGNPCALVVNAEVTTAPGSSNYLSFPLQFGSSATVPGAPTNVVATGGNGQATVTWSAPASNGGSPITLYTVTSTPGSFTCTDTALPLTCDVTGLTNGTPYTFTVVATNAVGDSPPSAPSNSVTPSAPSEPDAPTNVTAIAGDEQATVSWNAPSNNGGVPITEYTVTSTPGGETCTWTTGPLSCTVEGLTNGTPYTFTVVATNSIGDSDPSAASNEVTPNAPTGDLFTPVSPTRILDSRPAFQVGPYNTPWAAGLTRDVTVTNAGGVPADADAVTLNVTVTQTNAVSYLSIWPEGESQPVVSSLNWDPGWTVPNAVTVKVGTGGVVNVYNNLGTANVIVDVVGYYKESVGAGFTSVEPARILDSRPAFQVGPYNSPWAAAQTRDVTVAGVGGVPADAEAVVLNVTVTQTNAVGYLSIWPEGESQPVVSSLNWDPGWTIPNAVTVKVGTGGVVNVYNNLGTANVIVDVVGYFKTGSGFAFHPLSPERILDSRPAFQVGPFNTPWTAATTRNLTVTGGDVPVDADSVLLNSTVTQTNAVSYLSIWPNGQTQPIVSSLNWVSGWTISNAVTARVGTSGEIRIYNNLGTTNVLADLAGWYG